MYKISPKGKLFFLKALKIMTIDLCFFAVLISTLISCKKEEPEVPVLTGEISTPQDGFSCLFGDTIVVSGSITCDHPILFASVGLIDNNYATVVPGTLLGSNTGTTLNFSQSYVLDNPYASSGDYFLKISAISEGQNIELTQLRKIHVTAIPRTTIKKYCVLGSALNPSLYEFDDTSSTFIESYNFNFLDLKIDSRYKRIYLCGKEKVHGLNSETLNEEFQLSPLALNSDSFLSSELFSNQLMLSRNDGNIVFYNRDGQRQGETGENVFIRPQLTYSTNTYLYSSILKNSDRKIYVFFRPSGAPYKELLVDFDILGFNKITETEVLVFGNKNGHALIYKYLLTGNTVQLLKDIPSTIINSIHSFSFETSYMLTDNGIVKYDFPTNSTMTINNGVFSGMNYDEVNDILYCFSGSNIKQLQGTSYADLGDQMMPDSVMAVSVLYSK
ncbi:MAG: hypothetical protein KA285_02385 [Bacteroidia bacterium]|nr:hypothetical protein [Bacteroidia bacterium]